MLDTEPRLSVTACLIVSTSCYTLLEWDSMVAGALLSIVVFGLLVVTTLFDVALHFSHG
ncbi:hypothetical protein [Haloarchaeobius sp. DFWS5]|uniref:hypothetical protein n=1 Tax=Haloarchaeobius sp. DFWS5 TaxID=3446114 RepID=UPI003EBD5F63